MMAKTKKTADAEALVRIREARERLRDAESRYMIAKEGAKAAKATWEAAVEYLADTIDSETRPLPLFDQKPAAPVLPTVEVTGGTELHGTEAGTVCPVVEIKPGGVVVNADSEYVDLMEGEYETDNDTVKMIADAREANVTGPDAWAEFVAGWRSAENDAWRAMPLAELALAKKPGKILAEAGIETLGDLHDRMAEGLGWHDDLTGIGDETAGSIADRFAEFWKTHPEFCE